MLSNPLSRPRELVVGIGGVILLAALVLPWAGDANAWDAAPGQAAVCTVAGITAIACALTRGRIGWFRPDVSVGGAADMLSVAATIMLAGFFLDLPDGTSAEPGLIAALAAAFTIAMTTADWSPLRGAPAFPRLERTQR